MKKLTVLLFSALTLFSAAAAQPAREKGHKEQWKVQKVAYLTEVMDLTEKEAQVFWPIYNQAEKEKMESFKAVKQAYCDLDQGIKEGKGKKEIEALLDKYTAALEATKGIDSTYVSKYKRVLPVEKVAKLFVGEEAFRRQQIQRIGKK